jgi:hypothetical protein
MAIQVDSELQDSNDFVAETALWRIHPLVVTTVQPSTQQLTIAL